MDDFYVKLLKKDWITTWVMWSALLITQFVYLALGIYSYTNIEVSANIEFSESTSHFIIIGIAIVTILLTWMIRKKTLRNKIGKASEHPRLRVRNGSSHPVGSRYITNVIMSSATLQLTGLAGFFFCLLNKNLSILYVSVLISIVAMIFFRPKRSELDLILTLQEE
jgi:magnesium-transporting ATPase (P-type)